MLIRHWKKTVFVLLALFTGVTLLGDRRSREASLAPLVDFGELSAVCGPNADGVDNCLERARIMGVRGALVRPEGFDKLLRSGDILRFTDQELVKLKKTGVAAEAAPLEPNTIWMRERKVLDRVVTALDARGVRAESRRYGKMHVIALPRELQAESLSAGYDSEVVERVSAAGLLPFFYAPTGPDLLLAESQRVTGSFMPAPGYRHPESGLSRLREALRDGRTWVVFPDSDVLGRAGIAPRDSIGESPGWERASFLEGAGGAVDRALLAGELSPDAGRPAVLSRIEGKGHRVLLFHMDRGRAEDESFAALRRLIKPLADGGLSLDLPSGLRSARGLARSEGFLRYAAAFLLFAVGPLIALRYGVDMLRSQAEAGRLPVASPIREALLAAGVIACAAAAAGLASYALLSGDAWRLGATASSGWMRLAPLLTLAVAAAGLYLPDAPSASRDWLGSLRMSALPHLAAGAAAAALILNPDALEALGPRGWLESIAAWRPSLWWVPERWREWLVGTPCLFVGLCVLFESLRGDDGSTERGAPGEPRPWLLLGLLAPLGTIEFFLSTRTRFEAVLEQTAAGTLIGLALGAVLLGVRSFRRGPPPGRKLSEEEDRPENALAEAPH